MRRGTTPTIKIRLKGCNIDDLTSIYITFRQGNYEFEKTKDQLNIVDGKISIFLTQEETLKLDPMKNVLVQLRAKTSDDIAIASNIKSILVEDILKEVVI